MKISPNDHYYSKKPKSPLKINKIFTSIGPIAISLETSTGVFSKDEIDKGTRFLLEYLILPKISRKLLEHENNHLNILDLGAGYGPVSIYTYKKLKQLFSKKVQQLNNQKKFEKQEKISAEFDEKIRIYASEINERALWLLNRNIIANNCKKIEIMKGDFLQTIEKVLHNQQEPTSFKFSAIYTNPPLKLGHKYLLKLFEKAFNLLNTEDPTSFVQYVHKKSLGAQGFMKKVKKLRPNWHFHIIKKVSGYFIILVSPHKFVPEY